MGRAYQIMRDSALEAKGRDWRNLIVAFEVARVVAPWTIAGAVMGALGYGAWWVWNSWLAPAFTPAPQPATDSTVNPSVLGAVPGWLWIAAVVLAAAVFWVLRPGRIVLNSQRRVLELAGLVIVAAGLAGFGLFGITH